MKKLGAAALTLALAGAMTVPAFAAEDLLISPNPNAYATSITLNGETLDTTGVPAASRADLLPMRLVAEADHGSAYWDEENNEGWFNFGQDKITVQFEANTILVNDVAVNTTAEVVGGVTYVPAAVLEGLEGFSVTVEDSSVTITTPNNDPMVKLAYSIMENSEMYGMRTDEETLAEAYQFPVDQFEQVVAFFPMITSPDTIIVGKLAEGADEKVVTDALEAYRQSQEDTFSWYLSQHLPKVEDARTVIKDGYVFFFIGEKADEAEQMFADYVAAQA
ncbi:MULTISPECIES: DUF4358 domain-containing protein [Oscillospiraceae]|uniref:DUF4358 domain-containing protein n=1 Tax=Oscillospiraceae TaxID=216572 RepID=UPI000B38D6D6|nr:MULTISPECIES: DUF4358 domain-containing protein [Oscillospiraceae]MBM6887889.1 DUF4358 domain-containing protein [Pseudoflavonifractor phocaeensis]OUO36333.1 hypothetical protein B5F88_14065 [Flavonifractor sp. An306]